MLSMLLLAVVLILLYQFAVYRAERLISRAVNEHSGGKLQLHVEKVKFSLLALRFEFQQVDLITRDTSASLNAYYVNAERFLINVNSLLSVYVGRRIDIDSICIVSPEIGMVKRTRHSNEKPKLSEEVSKTFVALRKVLGLVRLNALRIEDASFVLYQNSLQDLHPARLEHIYLTVDDFTRENIGRGDKFLYADRVMLEVLNNHLVYCDSAGSIAFKRLSVSELHQEGVRVY